MIKIKKKLTIPEYRERKEIYETLGYKEIDKKEISEFKVLVTYEVDNTERCYPTIRRLERKLYRKGPPFFPAIIFVLASFILLSTFVILLAKEGRELNILTYALSLLLPAGVCLFTGFLYTFFYFSINKKIIEEVPIYKQDLPSVVAKIRNK